MTKQDNAHTELSYLLNRRAKLTTSAVDARLMRKAIKALDDNKALISELAGGLQPMLGTYIDLLNERGFLTPQEKEKVRSARAALSKVKGGES